MAAASELPLATDALPVPLPFDWRALVEPDLWALVPPDVPDLLALLRGADLYVQDEVDIRLHPTLTRWWSHKGRRGQRLVRAPGQNAKVVGFGAIDWRDGWLSHGIALGRTADVFCRQLDHLVARSQARGRSALVLADNLGIHTPRRSTLLRTTLARHATALRLIYTPAYDPDANPTERLWRPFRRRVTHNHQRACLIDLHDDAQRCFAAWDCQPEQVLSFIGSPGACTQTITPSLTSVTQ